MRDMLDLYLHAMRMSILEQFQYRVSNYFYMIGMLTEPIVYLVVWSTVARAQGGSVGGYTPGAFAAYYIVWMLVRNMNIVLTPFYWERRIRQGQLTGELLRPLHPIHNDLGYFAGWKFVVILMWLPIAIVLALLFQPTFNLSLFNVVVFFFAIWGGFLVRFFLLWVLGMLSFWTTRVGAVFDIYFTAELIFSGRLVPLSLLPPWGQSVANVLPFQWAFGYPIEVLIGQLTPQGALAGLGAQLFWILFGIVVVSLVWRLAITRFTAVGN